MRVTADALGYQISFAVEPRYRPARTHAAPDLVARLRACLALAQCGLTEPRLEELGADQRADVGLPADWRPRWEGRSHSIDLACRSLVPF
jgi:hypothetical protein